MQRPRISSSSLDFLLTATLTSLLAIAGSTASVADATSASKNCPPQAGATACTPGLGCELAVSVNHLNADQHQSYWPVLEAANAVDFVTASPVFLPPETKLYRVFGPGYQEMGEWWSLDPPPHSEALWRAGEAVVQSWNQGTHYVTAVVGNSGLRAWQGPAAAQQAEDACGNALSDQVLSGGTLQVYVDEEFLSQLEVTATAKTPWSD